MSASRFFSGLAILALSLPLIAQTTPTAYTITQTVSSAGSGAFMTTYRSGQHVVTDMFYPAQPGSPAHHDFTFYDLTAGTSHTWDPSTTPPSCSAGTFSGDWGDPFQATTEFREGLKKGDLKPSGVETLRGIPTKVYTGSGQGVNIKVWLDEKNGLVIRAAFGQPGAAMTTMVDITKVSLTPPPATALVVPAYCASVKPPPTAAELIADETGDSAANWVNGIYGPGTKASCSIVLHVVAAKTMAPINRKFQVAIDTTYNQDNPTPPSYTFGVRTDGTSTYSGGGLHEITSQVRNGILRIDNPPAYFNLSVNIPTPNHGAGVGLVYRQCFAPVTNLYYVVQDPGDMSKGADFLFAKSGKYAVAH
jgi:hypothetical protein